MPENERTLHTIALIGGTGPEGKGLATRFAIAGHKVIIGSRDPARGIEAAEELTEKLNTVPDSNITGNTCLLYTSPSPRDATLSRMPSSA